VPRGFGGFRDWAIRRLALAVAWADWRHSSPRVWVNRYLARTVAWADWPLSNPRVWVNQCLATTVATPQLWAAAAAGQGREIGPGHSFPFQLNLGHCVNSDG